MNRVFLAGYGNSLDGHWQEGWFKDMPGSHWVQQPDWDYPVMEQWVATFEQLMQSLDGPTLLISHSLGGATLVEWASRHTANIVGAFMVAVPDVLAPNFPDAIRGYNNPPLTPLPFPSMMVASQNDPYASSAQSQMYANVWGSQLVNIGPYGHINKETVGGVWPVGRALLNDFIATLPCAES